MKIKCKKEDLVKGINTVIRAVPSTTTMPILTCVLLEAEDEIVLTGNDLEIGIETKIEGEIKEKGTIAINAKMFSDVVKKLPEGWVTIEAGDQAKITCGKSKFSLTVESGKTYPKLKCAEGETVNIPGKEFLTAIKQVMFSIPANSSNQIFTGALFEIGKNLRVASIDGYRISSYTIDLDKEYDERRIVVPGKTIREIARIAEGDVELVISNSAQFNFDDTKLVSALLNGEFPNIDTPMKIDRKTKLVVTKTFSDSLERSLLLTQKDNKPVALNITDGQVKVSVETSMGSMQEEVEAEKEGDDLEIKFNAKFLLDCFKAIPDEKACMYFENRLSICIIEGENYKYAILPAR